MKPYFDSASVSDSERNDSALSRFFGQAKWEAAVWRYSHCCCCEPLCGLLGSFGGHGGLPCLLLGRELLIDLERNDIGVHLVRLGCGTENLASIRLRWGGYDIEFFNVPRSDMNDLIDVLQGTLDQKKSCVGNERAVLLV
jgi:hypothetical protein